MYDLYLNCHRIQFFVMSALAAVRYFSMSFAIGDLIIYGETGVCRVEGVVERPFLDSMQNCYKLQPIYQSCVIYTPVENSTVFMRRIITKDEADSLIESVRAVTPDVISGSSPRELSEKYDKIIKSHDCSRLLSFIFSIYEKKDRIAETKKKLSAVDERYLKKAEDLLFGEFAVAIGIEKSSVKGYIEDKCKVTV